MSLWSTLTSQVVSLRFCSVLARPPPPPVRRPHRRPRPLRGPRRFLVTRATAAAAASAFLPSARGHDLPLPDHVPEPAGELQAAAAWTSTPAARSPDVVLQGQSQVTFGGVTYYDTMQQQAQPKPSPPRRTSQPVTVKPPPPEVPFASE